MIDDLFYFLKTEKFSRRTYTGNDQETAACETIRLWKLGHMDEAAFIRKEGQREKRLRTQPVISF